MSELDRYQMVRQIADEIAAEVVRAERKHAPLNSPHEGWSVIYEELEELREHVRGNTGRSAEARKEAIQIAAMGLRYVLNLCDAAAPEVSKAGPAGEGKRHERDAKAGRACHD